MAEALLRARLDEREISGVAVASVGLLFDDRPAEPGAVAAMAKRGLDITDHRSRRVDDVLIADADLVVAMEQRHVRELVVGGADLDRTFTLPDLVMRAEAQLRGDEGFLAWIDRLAVGRTAAEMLGAGTRLEVEDPMGGSRRGFRRCADVLADLVDRFVAVAWPLPDADADLTPADADTWSTT
jgi:protein-tyrosine phosphatase